MANNHEREIDDSPGRSSVRAERMTPASVELEQRNGRGVRQGNAPGTVDILYYFANGVRAEFEQSHLRPLPPVPSTPVTDPVHLEHEVDGSTCDE